jgi:hypothetical protein
MAMNHRKSDQNIKMLEIELIVLLAAVLLLGTLFGYSLASPTTKQLDPSISGPELMQSGLGGEEIIPW